MKVQILFSLAFTLALTACGSNNSGGTPAATPPPSTGPLEQTVKAQCQNDLIAVNELGAALEPMKQMPKGTFHLQTMHLYVLTKTGDSFKAQANDTTGFKVENTCNGVSAKSDLRATLNTADEIKLPEMLPSGITREMSVKFKAGQIIQSQVALLASGSTEPMDLDKIPKGRFQTGPGTFMTINVEPLDDARFTFKLKIENDDLVEYGAFIYQLNANN